MVRIGLTGAGGTGKGTLANALSSKILHDTDVKIPVIPSFISEISKKISPESKNYSDMTGRQKLLQQYSILSSQINAEMVLNSIDSAFISERSILDYLPYMEDAYKKHEEITQEDYEAYKTMILSTLMEPCYDYIIYLPVEFRPTNTDLQKNSWKERDEKKQHETDMIIRNFVNKIPWMCSHKGVKAPRIIVATGSVEERIHICKEAGIW